MIEDMHAQKVSLKFSHFPDFKLATFARSVILGLTDNPAFSNPPVTVAKLTDATEDFSTACVASERGGVQQTAAKNEARAVLINLLHQLATYVQCLARYDLPMLLSSGFTSIRRNTAPSPLATPQIIKLKHERSAELLLRCQPVANARSYQVQLRKSGGEWQFIGDFSQARRIVVPNLVPGTVYDLQVRAVGGSTGYSDWSPAVSGMSL